MAVDATTVWEVRSTGSDNNGGGYSSGGTDWTQQNSPQYAFTGATSLTSAGAGNVVLCPTASSDMIGNVIHVISGTNFTSGLTAFFPINSIVAGVSFTCGTNIAGASISTGVGVAGVANIGGALKLDSASTGADTILENAQPGNTWHIMGGSGPISYTINGAVSLSVAGTNLLPIKIIGNGGTRGDNPSTVSGLQPILNFGVNTLTSGTYWRHEYIGVTGTPATLVTAQGGSGFYKCKITNTSGSTNRIALSLNGSESFAIECDLSSTLGKSISVSNANTLTFGCYLHDCQNGFYSTVSSLAADCINNIINNCSVAGINIATAVTGQLNIIGNTIYGAETPAGTGVLAVTGSTDIKFFNNIVYGWTTGLNQTDTNTSIVSKYNNVFNCTTARTNWAADSTDIALTPAFTDAPNGDFRVGANMKAVGFPGVFPGGLSTGYKDIGAVQRKEDYPLANKVETGVSFGNGLTGTLSAGSAIIYMGNN